MPGVDGKKGFDGKLDAHASAGSGLTELRRLGEGRASEASAKAWLDLRFAAMRDERFVACPAGSTLAQELDVRTPLFIDADCLSVAADDSTGSVDVDEVTMLARRFSSSASLAVRSLFSSSRALQRSVLASTAFLSLRISLANALIFS